METTRSTRNKIVSVQNLQKITRAMEMIAAFKMRKFNNYIVTYRNYCNNILEIIIRLIKNNLAYLNSYLQDKNYSRRIGYIVLSTDHGLCGSLNINVFKKTISDINIWLNKNIQSDFL